MTSLRRALIQERGFVVMTAAIGALRFLPGRAPGALETWATILALWLAGWMMAAWRGRGEGADLASAVGAQNVAIQLLIAVPGIVLGLSRLLVASDQPTPSAFVSNALGTLIVLPLASLVVLTLAALPLAHALRLGLRRVAPARS